MIKSLFYKSFKLYWNYRLWTQIVSNLAYYTHDVSTVLSRIEKTIALEEIDNVI